MYADNPALVCFVMSGDVGYGLLGITMLQAMSIAEPMGVGFAKVLHGADLTLRGRSVQCFKSRHDAHSGPGKLIGYDNSEAMLQQARGAVAAEGLGHRIELRIGDLEQDPHALTFDNAGAVLLCWTLQFVRPLQREALIPRIHESLAGGGVLVVTEKVLSNARDLDRDFIDFHYAFKERTGYSQTEIHKKRVALENVLVPYRIDENHGG
jgi:tRNA (cmo5U34)-methyltransferase